MRLDPFLKVKSADPDEVIVSKAAPFLGADAPVQIGGTSVPHTAAAAPPGPRICESDGDQDTVAQEETYAPDGVRIPGGEPSNPDVAVFRTAAAKGEVPPGILSGDPVLHDDKKKTEKTFRPFGEAVAKMWSDEARAAAAEARKHGWQASHQEGKESLGNARVIMKHPDLPGHQLEVGGTEHGEVAWTHTAPNNSSYGKKQPGRQRVAGNLGTARLKAHLDNIHGDAVGKSEDTLFPVLDVEKIGWTDEARAAAAAARGLKDPKGMGLKRVHPGSKIGGDSQLHWNESNPHETEFAHAYAEHERASNQGRAPKAGTPQIRRLPGGRAGFAGSGESSFRMQQSNGESHDFHVGRHANGRGFWGTSHVISHLGPSASQPASNTPAPDAGARTYDEHARPGAI